MNIPDGTKITHVKVTREVVFNVAVTPTTDPEAALQEVGQIMAGEHASLKMPEQPDYEEDTDAGEWVLILDDGSSRFVSDLEEEDENG